MPPTILDGSRPRTLVWTSLWTRHPELVLRFDCAPDQGGTRLRVCLDAPDEAELSDATVGHLRHRVNRLLFADLRATYGQ